MTEELREIRLDLCLYNLRFCKTRPLAQTLIEKGRVRVNGEKATKSSRKIRLGDILVFPAHNDIQSIEILELPPKRLGAPLAAEHYRKLEDLHQSPLEHPRSSE